MLSIELRNYQESDIAKISSAFAAGINSVLYVLPTGGGKSVIFAYISKKLSLSNKRVLILTDREELLDGSASALVRERVHPYIINGKSKRLNTSHNVYIAMSQTIKRRMNKPDYMAWLNSTFDYVIIDEAHKEEFNPFFIKNVFGKAKVLGVTATAKRWGKSRQLAMDYQLLIQEQTTEKLILDGWLCYPDYVKADLDIEWGEMRTSQFKGELDYRIEDVAKVMDNKTIYDGMIELMKKETPDEVTIVFCSSSANTIKTCLQLNEAGIPAKYIISEPDEKEGKELHSRYKDVYSGERRRLISNWKHGHFKVMVNNGILTTGFDYPAITSVVINRRTMNTNLFLQMCGRGSRPIKGFKTRFTIIDMADNIKRMGDWHADRVYSLRHSFKTKGGSPPMKYCPKCLQSCFASQKVCDNISATTYKACGFTFPVEEKKVVKVAFKKTSYEELEWNELTLEMKQKMTFEELEIYRSDKKYPEGWIRFVARETGRLEQYKLLKRQLADARNPTHH